jgi:hypothetical protein
MLTLRQLFAGLARRGFAAFSVDARDCLVTARAGSLHPALLNAVVCAWLDWLRPASPDTPLARAELVNALGPLRRAAMADQLVPADFRLLGTLIEALDDCFDHPQEFVRPSTQS